MLITTPLGDILAERESAVVRARGAALLPAPIQDALGAARPPWRAGMTSCTRR